MGQMTMAGGWLMLPILLCSVLGLAIVIERAWALRATRVAPPALTDQLARIARAGALSASDREALAAHSPLGQVWAAVAASRGASPDQRRERIEEAGRRAAHDMSRYLNTLGTIAAIAPLLGLLGTVAGMIDVFAALEASGAAGGLAGGIGQALLTTAAGLCVAIPALAAHRYFTGCVAERALLLERWAVRLMDTEQGSPAAAR